MRALHLIVGAFLFGLLAGGGMWASMEIGSWLFPHGVFGRYIGPLLAGIVTTIVAIPVGFLFVGLMACLFNSQRLPQLLLTAVLLITPVAIGLYELDMRDARPILNALSGSEYRHPEFVRDTHGDVLLRALLTTIPAALVTTAWLASRVREPRQTRPDAT